MLDDERVLRPEHAPDEPKTPRLDRFGQGVELRERAVANCIRLDVIGTRYTSGRAAQVDQAGAALPWTGQFLNSE